MNSGIAAAKSSWIKLKAQVLFFLVGVSTRPSNQV